MTSSLGSILFSSGELISISSEAKLSESSNVIDSDDTLLGELQVEELVSDDVELLAIDESLKLLSLISESLLEKEDVDDIDPEEEDEEELSNMFRGRFCCGGGGGGDSSPESLFDVCEIDFATWIAFLASRFELLASCLYFGPILKIIFGAFDWSVLFSISFVGNEFRYLDIRSCTGVVCSIESGLLLGLQDSSSIASTLSFETNTWHASSGVTQSFAGKGISAWFKEFGIGGSGGGNSSGSGGKLSLVGRGIEDKEILDTTTDGIGICDRSNGTDGILQVDNEDMPDGW